MENYYSKIKDYLLELQYDISLEDPSDGIFIIDKESDGISNMVLGVAGPILIIEQFIFRLTDGSAADYKKLLMKNRDIVHGAFVLDESGDKVLFRDTLQIENLDLNELEASLESLSLLLVEFSEDILQMSSTTVS